MNKFFGSALLATSGVLLSVSAQAAGNLAIGQVYSNGGSVGATYHADFVEIFNRSSSSQSLAGLTIQYASAAGTGNFAVATTLSGSIAPGQRVLVRMGATGANGSVLPTPDFTNGTAMAGAGGKVLLANSTTAIACNGGSTPCSGAQTALFLDLVGFGTANYFEGAATAPAGSVSLSALRAADGCTDSDSNTADFATSTPTPRNTASAATPCTAAPTLSIAATASVAEGNTGCVGGTTALNFQVTSSAAAASDIGFTFSTTNGTATSGSDFTTTGTGTITTRKHAG